MFFKKGKKSLVYITILFIAFVYPKTAEQRANNSTLSQQIEELRILIKELNPNNEKIKQLGLELLFNYAQLREREKTETLAWELLSLGLNQEQISDLDFTLDWLLGIKNASQKFSPPKENLAFEFKLSWQEYQGNKYKSGGRHYNPSFDIQAMRACMKEGISYGIDPAWMFGIVMVEYGGLTNSGKCAKANYARVGAHNIYAGVYGFMPMDSTAMRDLALPYYNKKLKKNLAQKGFDIKIAGFVLESKGIQSPKIQGLKTNFYIKPILFQQGRFDYKNYLASPIAVFHFTQAKIFQDRVLHYTKKYKSLSRGLQVYQGYGWLDGEDKQRYPHIKATKFSLYGKELLGVLVFCKKNKAIKQFLDSFKAENFPIWERT